MKLHECAPVPNCRRVTIYLREKGLPVDRVAVDLMNGEHKTAGFRQKNPAGKVPVLELDDGSYLSESLAIIEYLEELNPAPPMIGSTPEQRAQVRALERQVEFGIFLMAGIVFQNTAPFFADRFHQSQDTVAFARGIFNSACRAMNKTIGEHPFVAGEAPSIADCTLAAGMEFASRAGLEVAPENANLLRWWADFAKRPSVAQ